VLAGNVTQKKIIMKTKFQSIHKMEFAVTNYLDQQAKVINPIPEFGTLLISLKYNLGKMQIIIERQKSITTGISHLKKQFKADLVTKTLDISRRIHAYAKITNRSELVPEVAFSESNLRYDSENNVKDRALKIHELAQKNLSVLTPYGVKEETLADLKTAIDLFIESIPKTRLVISDRKQATEELERLFKANNDILEKMDALVEMLRMEQPEFYTSYWSNRRVIETGKSSLALKAMVTDTNTHSGIKGVKVSFVRNGQLQLNSAKTNTPMVKRTTVNGGFWVRNLAAGTYTATIAKLGYKEKVVTVNVPENEMTELYVELERN
jgi:hypothetical protein